MIPYPRIVAHRCGGALAPENTLPGLEIAARLGCRGVEFDVMLSADGVPVLIHDETLERTTDGSGPVCATQAADLARLDAGARHHKAFAASPPPTFAQALAACRRLGLWANVEIKPAAGHEEETGRVVASLLAGQGPDVPGVLSSFSEVALATAMEVAPQLPRALLVVEIPADVGERLRRLECLALHFAGNNPPAAIAALREAGIPFACYTINRRADGEALRAAGAMSIITDRPDLWAAEEM